MRQFFSFVIAVAASAATFYQCSPASEKKVEEAQEEIKRDIVREKQEVATELGALRDDINDRLDKISTKLETAGDKSKAELEEAKQNLEEQRTKIEKSLDEIDQATDSAWDDIQQRARKTGSDIKIEFQELGEKIDKALKGD